MSLKLISAIILVGGGLGFSILDGALTAPPAAATLAATGSSAASVLPATPVPVANGSTSPAGTNPANVANVAPTAVPVAPARASAPQPAGRGAAQGGSAQSLGDLIAQYLGISTNALQLDLQGGQTLSQIAVANGKTAASLKAYILDQTKATYDQAVAGGRLSSQQEVSLLATAGAQVDQLMNATFTQPAGGDDEGSGQGRPRTLRQGGGG